MPSPTRPRHVGTVSAVVALAALTYTVPAGGAVGEPTDQWYPVPGSGTYVVNGHGYGHGHGMSQYGAQGAALRGLSDEQILAFYYPGTALRQAKGKMRVFISADTGSDLVVGARSGLRLTDRGNGSAYDLPTGLGATRWRLSVDSQNRDRVSWYDGSWHGWRPGGKDALSGDGQFKAQGKPLTLFLPTTTAKYRGALRNATPSYGGNDRNTVNVLGLDAYVRGVVASEMPASWEPEAVQAQAVAARTYAARARADAKDRSYDICDTPSCQVYKGVAGEHPLADDAVRSTAKQVLKYDGQPAFTQFSSSSGGWTSAGSAPYLPAKQDPYDGWSGNPNHDWSLKVSAQAIANAWPSIGKLVKIHVTSRDGNGEWGGRVWQLVLVGSRGKVTLSGEEFRSRFGLRSTWFSFG